MTEMNSPGALDTRHIMGWLAQWQAAPDAANGLAAACSAVLWLAGRDALDAAPQGMRQRWGAKIQASQRAGSEWFAEQDPGDWAAARASRLALQALDALGWGPREWPAALGAEPTEWLAALDWSRPLAAGARAALRLQWLALQAEQQAEGPAAARCQAMLDWLDQAQDHATGLWGPAQGSDLDEALLAAPGLLVFFEYVRRPVCRVRQLIDLALERVDQGQLTDSAGLVGRTEAAASLAWLLATYQQQFRYRRDDMVAALARLGDELAAGEVEAALASAAGLEAAWWAALAHALAAPETANWHFARRPGPGCFPRARLTPHERQVLPRWLRPARAGAAHAPAQPAITVVIPVFNLGRYLPEAVDSVLAQTYQDFELIVIDDGSTDEHTRLLLADWPYPRARLIHQANQGVAAARNRAIAEGRGRYVCCLDADDRLRPGYFERAAALLEADPTVGLVTGTMQLFDSVERVLAFATCGLPEMLVENCSIEPAVFRRAAWEQAGGYCVTFSESGIEDWDLWLGLLERGYRAAVIPEVVMDYRIRPDSMSTRMYAPEHWARLMRELAARHAATYQRYLAEAVGVFAQRKMELTEWAENRERARAWWERQARNWERLAAQREAVIGEQQAWIAELEAAKAWLDGQRQNWQALAEARERRIAELEARLTRREKRR